MRNPNQSSIHRPWTGFLVLILGSLVLNGCGDVRDELPTSPPVQEQAAERPSGADLAHLQDFGPAIQASERHTSALMAMPGVVGTGVGLNDAGRPALKIFLVHEHVRGIPTELDGVPVAVDVTGPFHARADRTARARPAPIGFSVGHPDITAGTLGARVASGTSVFILSNNHVIANSNDADLGDPTLQPGAFDGGSEPDDVIGTLADYEEILFDGSNNEMDAAISAVDGADVSGATPDDEGYGAPGTTVTTAAVGMAVQKYGRTTGHTHGTVEEINVTVDVCYGGFPFCTKLARFVNQISIGDGNFSDGGDSGSLIVTDGSGNNPVGLLFAGSSTRTIANPIGPVLARFEVSIDPTDPGDGGGTEPDPTGPTASFTSSCTDLACDFDGSGSTAGDAAIASYDWDFGDGTSGSGVTVSHEYGSADTYTVTLTVTDEDGLTDSESQDVTVSDSSDPGGDNPPTIDTFNVSTRTTGPWRRADVTWAVSDEDGDLASVLTELLDSGGSVLDSASSSVSGSSASGEHNLRTRSGTPTSVRITVTDANGNASTDTQSVSF